LKLSNKLIILVFSFVAIKSTLAQEVETYLFPIQPGMKNYLAGTMGELRTTHFHAGIDVKTGGAEGLSVYATKSGYITRIKVATGGYGLVLYMLHPDGNTSVYAHLRKFAPSIERYVKAAQYEQKTFEIELFPQKNQFSFARGEEIAKSGNTGGSTGPHLHFEIRDANQKVLNPLHYGFSEIKDGIPPIVQDLSIRPRNTNSRVNNQFARTSVKLGRNGFNYAAEDTIYASGDIGLELLAHDKLDGAANKNGVSIIEVRVNESLYYKQVIDDMSFSNQRDIMVHYPYEVKINRGKRYHKLYVDEGNTLDFYEASSNQGWLNVMPDSVYQVSIDLYDPYKNKSTLELTIKGAEKNKLLSENIEFELDRIDYEIAGKVLKVYAMSACISKNNTALSLRLSDRIEDITPSYYQDNVAVYLWDLTKGKPESVLTCGPGATITEHEIEPGKMHSLKAENFEITVNKGSLYDVIYLNTNYSVKSTDSIEIFSAQPTTYPLKRSVTFSLSPQHKYVKDKAAVYATNGEGNFSHQGGTWNGDNINFSTRYLGDFTILEDSIPPKITRLSNSLFFSIRDNLSGIKSYNAYLNDRWVLLRYEPKKDMVWVDWLNDTGDKSGDFRIEVSDEVGNISTLKFNL